jgi:hypothetical protein
MAAVHDLMPVLPGRPFSALGMLQAESQVTLAHYSCQEGFGRHESAPLFSLLFLVLAEAVQMTFGKTFPAADTFRV